MKRLVLADLKATIRLYGVSPFEQDSKVEDVEAFMEELAAAAAGNSTHEEHQTSRI